MAKKQKRHPLFAHRTLFQLIYSALTNGYALGFVRGTIFTGWSKQFCVPGLNCYSCPGALGACPIGALQAVLGSRKYHISLYMIGFFLLIGSLFGRLICGFACPFGLVQDLIYKIPLLKRFKRKHLPGHRVLKYLKYVILVCFAILLPLVLVDRFGQGQPQFCKWICPSGTLLGGWPLLAVNEQLRGAAGWLFVFKSALCAAILVCSLLVYRPFCKYLCPLGAIYSPFNKVALLCLKVDGAKCIDCGACGRACKMGIEPQKTPNSLECIRCGDCVRRCPTGAIEMYHFLKMPVPTGAAARPDSERV